MIKIVCVIFVLLPQTPDGSMPVAKFEKEFHSVQECLAWKHQQAYAPVTRYEGGTLFFCEKYLEI